MILIGDIGNTEIKIALYSNSKKLIKNKRINTNFINKQNLNSNFRFLNKYLNSIEKILFCSVVPKKFLLIKNYLSKKTKLKCFELKQLNIEKLINIKVNRKQIGSDRLANAISISKPNKNFIIVDFGTATNFDVVIKNNYIGGVLAPGVQLSLSNLINKASLIPPINLNKIKKVIGKNTSSAIKSGFYHGYTGLIDNIIKLIIKQTKKNFSIILTGGLAHLFVNSIKGKVQIKKDLTISGVLKVTNLIK